MPGTELSRFPVQSWQSAVTGRLADGSRGYGWRRPDTIRRRTADLAGTLWWRRYVYGREFHTVSRPPLRRPDPHPAQTHTYMLLNGIFETDLGLGAVLAAPSWGSGQRWRPRDSKEKLVTGKILSLKYKVFDIKPKYIPVITNQSLNFHPRCSISTNKNFNWGSGDQTSN